MKNLIIGTAGHVDHGKTEIVRALTGKNTDRLKEEQKRGISIVLGFAPLELGEGITAGIVDVPGHERFVKNMVSGAVGVDIALMTVAADEGVMPQTVEHFEVLRLLGVSRGVIAVTKIDLADPDMAEIVESEIADMLEGSQLEGCPMVRTSSVTGEGIEKLRELLREQAEGLVRSKGRDFFRLPVDRVFSRPGIGTIVTGTSWSGEVSKGDELEVVPGGMKVRVREVHNFEHVLGSAEAGMRTALALHGVKTGEVSPGHQVITAGAVAETSMLDVFVEMSRIPGSTIKNRQRVRLHHAAAEILARAVVLGSEEINENEKGYLQLRLESPAAAVGGDRFVLRTYSPMRVLAGGIVLDPAPEKARRSDKARVAFLGVLAHGSRAEAFLAVVDREGDGGASRATLGRFGFSGVEIEDISGSLLESGSVLRLGEKLVLRARAESGAARIGKRLGEFSKADPLIWGIDREQLRSEAGFGGGPLFDHLLEKGIEEGTLFFRGGKVRGGSPDLELSAGDRKLIDSISLAIRSAGVKFLQEQELREAAGEKRQIGKYLHILTGSGAVKRIGEYGYISAEAIDELRGWLGESLGEGGSVNVGDLKERFGLSRKYAVPIFEFLDAEGYTVRRENSRIAGPKLGKPS